MSGAVDEVQRRSRRQGRGIGFCMGGGIALVLATQRPDAVAAVVPCYGIIPWPDAQPDYAAMSAAVLGHYAEKDGFFTPEAAEGWRQLRGWARRSRSSSTRCRACVLQRHAPELYDAELPRLWDRMLEFVTDSTDLSNARRDAGLELSPGRAPEPVCYHRAMSARSRDLPRRSCLSTPGSNEKFLAKAPTVPADMTFLDLEDAVAPLEKVAARPKVVDAIKNLPWDERVLCVRVNAWDTEWTYGDVIEVVGNAGERLDEIMLPKVQSAAEVVALDLLLTQVEKNSGLPVGHVGIEAQIETARGSSTSTRSAPRRRASRRSSSVRRTSPPASRCRCSRAGSIFPSIPAITSTTSSAAS